MAKLYDLAVVVGSFTTQSGDEKKRWKNGLFGFSSGMLLSMVHSSIGIPAPEHGADFGHAGGFFRR